jgi:hypothetical protein
MILRNSGEPEKLHTSKVTNQWNRNRSRNVIWNFFIVFETANWTMGYSSTWDNETFMWLLDATHWMTTFLWDSAGDSQTSVPGATLSLGLHVACTPNIFEASKQFAYILKVSISFTCSRVPDHSAHSCFFSAIVLASLRPINCSNLCHFPVYGCKRSDFSL